MKTDSASQVKSELPWDPGLKISATGQMSFAGRDLGDYLTQSQPPRPFYLLSLQIVGSRALAYRQVLESHLKQKLHFHFAMKSNNHPRLLQTLAKAGFGVDVVSGGEMKHATQNGFAPHQVVFSGVAKSRIEIQEALQADVGQLNIESLPELVRVTEIAARMGRQARIAIRFNPEVRAETHPYIATGFRENKFGVDRLDFPALREWILAHPKVLQYQGLSLHIGSQLLDFSALGEAIEKSLKLEEENRAHGLIAKSIDVGGGVGIHYKGDEAEDLNTLMAYAETLQRTLAHFPGEIHFEPGRFWTARAGVLVSRVEYVKRTPYKNFLVSNVGMNALLRPMLYQAYHRIEIYPRREGASEVFDVVGPVCESSDVLGTLREYRAPQENDFLCICEAGAYGAVLASGYNLLGVVPELIWEDL